MSLRRLLSERAKAATVATIAIRTSAEWMGYEAHKITAVRYAPAKIAEMIVTRSLWRYINRSTLFFSDEFL